MIDEQLDLKSPVIAFRGSLTETDPVTNPVLVIGQMKHLSELDFGKISVKFGKLMDKKVFVFDTLFVHHSYGTIPFKVDGLQTYSYNGCMHLYKIPLELSKFNFLNINIFNDNISI